MRIFDGFYAKKTLSTLIADVTVHEYRKLKCDPAIKEEIGDISKDIRNKFSRMHESLGNNSEATSRLVDIINGSYDDLPAPEINLDTPQNFLDTVKAINEYIATIFALPHKEKIDDYFESNPKELNSEKFNTPKVELPKKEENKYSKPRPSFEGLSSNSATLVSLQSKISKNR